jgi:predicted DNA-binding transcriptional regulator YafY
LLALSSAAHGWQRVHMAYRSADDEITERDFDAYGLAFRRGRWYVVGWCHLRGALRSFRLDRVQEVRPLNVVFTPPADFNAAQYLVLGLATMPRTNTVRLLLHTDLQTAQMELPDSIGVFQPSEEGVLLHSQTDHIPWFARQLSRLPFAFEIQEPPALRTALREHAQRTLDQHAA